MSDSAAARANDPADFGRNKASVARALDRGMAAGRTGQRQFTEARERVNAAAWTSGRLPRQDQTKFNVFWSNIQTLKPAICAHATEAGCAAPVSPTRWRAPPARSFSGRSRPISIKPAGNEVTDQCGKDYLVVGRGTPWARYEPHFENVSAGRCRRRMRQEDGEARLAIYRADGPEEHRMGPIPNPHHPRAQRPHGPEDDGLQITNDTESRSSHTRRCWDYVHWRDFRHSPSRVWQEVRWVNRLVLMTMDEGVERFGDDVPRRAADWRPRDGRARPVLPVVHPRPRGRRWDKLPQGHLVLADYGASTLDEKDDSEAACFPARARCMPR